jgi:hypothetical protein
LAQTLYPGGRRSEGGGLGVPLLSGPFDFVLARGPGAAIQGTNQSEASLGWIIVVILALVVWGTSSLLGSDSGKSRVRRRWTATLVLGVVLFAWGTVKWPSILLDFNPLQLIPGERLMQILSVVWLVPALLMLFPDAEALEGVRRRRVAASGALVVFILTLTAGNGFRANVPGLTVGWVWAISVMMLIGCFALVMWPKRMIGLIPLAVMALWSTATVNPLVRGLGDLVNSRSAAVLSETVRGESEMRRVGSDDIFVDALVAANGLPLMSGQQGWGPNREAYQMIDPMEVFQDQWNRGASFVRFFWDESLGEDLSVAGEADQIVITISPCNSGLGKLGMGWVISTRPLSSSCLEGGVTFRWMDVDRWLYRLV